MKATFYPEIQGLRAIAVISIFLYHLQLNSFQGGFVGVDIFFVISGFLITKILFEKKISLISFYISRIKRITPALIITILIVFLLVTCIFLPEHLEHFYQSINYTLLFSSNIFFWLKSADYFNINNYFQPLLHTWSLSLEMQFYLIIPFFIFVLKKFSKKSSIIISLSIIFLSLTLSVLFVGREQSFYFLPFRLCEFLVGTIVYLIKEENYKNKFNNLLFVLSILFLLYLILSINNLNFPGFKGMLIATITGLAIYFDPPKKSYLIINSSIVQFCGLISYSFFLIHWPVIVIYKYIISSSFELKDYLIISIITFLLSSFSYFFVEKKFQNIDEKKFIKIFAIYPALFLIIIFMSKTFIKDLEKYNFFMNNEKKLLFNKLETYNDERENFLEITKISKNDKINENASIIFGDSHANDIFLGLKQNKTNEKFYYVSNNLDCFQILSENKKIHFFEVFKEYFLSKKSVGSFIYNSCLDQVLVLEKLIKSKNIDHVIISMKWNEKELAYLPYIINLIRKYNIEIILISKRIEIPHIGIGILKNSNLEELNYYINENLNRFSKINNELKELTDQYNLKFFDLNEFICKTKSKNCNFVNNNDFKYLDYSHFTLNFGKKLMKETIDKIK